MSFLKRLFGRAPEATAPGSSPSAGPQFANADDAASPGRPFDVINGALQAWHAKDHALAERLFVQGIAAYRRREPSGLDFALGRYGAFLAGQERNAEAERVLHEAVELNTDIPAIWSDYLRLITDRRDLEAFKDAVGRMQRSTKGRFEPEFVLAHARRADREGDGAFAEGLARWVVAQAAATRDKDGRWGAIGDLGRIIERQGRVDEAVRLWSAAFDEGSTDPETVGQLSKYHEQQKDYQSAGALVREALKRGLPANVNESLRKRLVRCESKAEGNKKPAGRRADVPAFTILQDSAFVQLAFQLRVRPAVKDLELLGPTARCLLVSKESSTLLDIDLGTGTEVRRLEGLPVLGDTWFAPDGRGIAVRRTAAIGKGPALLTFLGPDGHVAAEASVPDATSQIALGPDVWYVGCRDGYLYGFGLDGEQRWRWATPGSESAESGPYSRPCPYHVAARQSFAAVASMGNIYAVSPEGRTLWHAALPNERQTRWEFTVPVGISEDLDEAYQALELQRDAPAAEVRAAYRRLAFGSHPDHNATDPKAANRFRTVQGAYERILASPQSGAEGGRGVTLVMEFQGIGPTATFLAASNEGVAVGSSQGRLYEFSTSGRLRAARVLGDGPVRVALRQDGALGAAWCGDALLFFTEQRVVSASEALTWPRDLTMFGHDVVMWHGNEVRILDGTGRLLWAAQFSKALTHVAVHGDTLVCAAGVLAVFRKVRVA